ncbi:uncharacterized protein ACWYII_008375 [Salvelinus alpinus]
MDGAVLFRGPGLMFEEPVYPVKYTLLHLPCSCIHHVRSCAVIDAVDSCYMSSAHLHRRRPDAYACPYHKPSANMGYSVHDIDISKPLAQLVPEFIREEQTSPTCQWPSKTHSFISCPGGWSQMILQVKKMDVEVLCWRDYTWMSVGGVGRVVRYMGNTWARCLPG